MDELESFSPGLCTRPHPLMHLSNQIKGISMIFCWKCPKSYVLINLRHDIPSSYRLYVEDLLVY